MLRRTQSNRITASMPEESPRGTGVASVLTSPLFGLESQLDPFSLRVLQSIYRVSLDKKNPNRQRHLKRLRTLVPALAPKDSSPDPYRTIAKLAYEVATRKVLAAGESPDWKAESVEKLSSLLYDDARGHEE